MALNLIPANTNIKFIEGRWVAFVVSFFMIMGSLFLLADRGLNFGIDFAGGIVMDVRSSEPVDIAALRSVLDVETFGEVSLQHFGDEQEVLIRMEVSEESEQGELVKIARERIENALPDADFRQVDYVGPTIGDELIESGVVALVTAFVAVLLYVWFRFEWQFGLGAIVALLHDAILILGFYAFMGYDFGLTSIAAILTVIGYSINDSVVIYDRVRETMRKYKKMPVAELLNKSVNNTLSRTIITALTTVLAAAALVWFGGEVLRGFSAALLFGVIVGTYSSIYVAGPILLYFGVRKEEAGAPASA